MNVVFLGSTQTKHIRKIYDNCSWKVAVFKKSSGSVFAKLDNFSTLFGADLVYCVGGMDCDSYGALRLAKALGKKIIIHWIGTDVLIAGKKYLDTGKVINSDVINLAVSEELCKELRNIGVNSEYVPIVPPCIPYPPAPEMPKSHAVLAYLPKGREDFYGWQQIKFLAGRFPNIPFYIVANDGLEVKNIPSNIKFKGFLPHSELEKLYSQISILLRLTEHDGLPVMMLEAQGMGRKVIHYNNFPFVMSPADKSDQALLELFSKLVSTPPKLDTAAKEYVDKTFSFSNILSIYMEKGLV